MKPWLLLLAMILVASAAHAAPARRHQPELRYVISGSIVLGVFYALPLALAIRYEEGELALPVLGPLIDLRRCRDCTGSPVGKGVVSGLVLDAALQAAGAALLTMGLVRSRPAHFAVTPTSTGIAIGGRF